MPSTIYNKIWESHVVHEEEGKPSLIYIDRHFVHEVTSPQAFEGLRLAGRKVRRPDLAVATMDHNVPTSDRSLPILDEIGRKQVERLALNCKEFDITLFDLHSPDQGIVHVIGPELGLTLPGATIVCGDSHTSTHGALGAFALGIGTSEVEHVLATQCLWMEKSKIFDVTFEGIRGKGVTPKDLILYLIGKIGTSGGSGSVIEYRGQTIRDLSIEERMTVCNMTIEGGARAGLISPDEKTFDYIRDGEYAPKGEAFERAMMSWKDLGTDDGAHFDKNITIQAGQIAPQVSWGTNPSQVADVTASVPDPARIDDRKDRNSAASALEYMGIKAGTPITELALDRVFIGSCTNSRITDLVAAAAIVKGQKVSDHVRAMVVPGSQRVKREGERMGLNTIFENAGFEWRESGCSMCLGMNEDILRPGERCASTSNRNFEGRQGSGGRTHLASPIMVAAAALEGHFIDIRAWL
ncbi:MAG: 3-isopropylmalate dehydratase large subunit [Nitrososphaerales archaeon]